MTQASIAERVVRRAIAERLTRASEDVALRAKDVEGAAVEALPALVDECWRAASRIQDVTVAVVALERRDVTEAARMMARLDGETDATAWLVRGAAALDVATGATPEHEPPPEPE